MTAKEVHEIRTELGLTMKQLATFLGVTEAAVSRLEAGQRKVSGPIARLLFLLQRSKGRLYKNPPWGDKI